MKRFAALLFAVLVTISVPLFLPLQVSANSPPPAPFYIIKLSDLPEGTAYVDLLVYLPESDPYYTELAGENLPEGFSAQSEIVTYQQNDFRSYTFHYASAKSSIRADSADGVLFFMDSRDNWENIRHDHMEDIEAKGEIRLAMLDAEGNIIQLSQTFLLKARKFLGSIEGYFVYNGAADTLEIEERTTFFGYAVYGILAFMGITLTCLLEWGVARLMGLGREDSSNVGLVNIFSQILMHILYIAFYSVVFWRYTVALVLLEVLVYVGEFLYYRFVLLRHLSVKKCLLFTVTANTASLLLGMLALHYFGVFI